MEENRSRMVELNQKLREASRAYYQENREIMSNFEYDALYDELVKLEQETGVVLSNSVTANVGYEVLSQLPKVEHETPMLSLDKTKSVETLQEWLGENAALLSWKLDGLTVVLTYEGGRLQQAVTRGNGYIGEDITNNAPGFENLPGRIPYEGKLVVRGEAVIRYSDFNEEFSGEYKNPRNLCSGSVRQLDPAVTASRHVNCILFHMVSGPDLPTLTERFAWLERQGFEVVEHVPVTRETLPAAVASFAEKIEAYDIPSDGLVLTLDDIAYGLSLGTTAKFPRNAIAFKWADETASTKLLSIEWSPSRTGRINPVAIFEPVEIEGTTVSRASVHNVSILRELELGEGDELRVYKANMIIPQIEENLTRSGTVTVPDHCPVCGAPAELRKENDSESLYCTNPDCPAKQIKSYALLASRDALNIDGMSEMTLEKLIGAGWIREKADIFRLERYRQEIAAMDGFGEKSADNMIAAAAKAAKTTTARFLYGLGIPEIGVATAKALAKRFSLEQLREASQEELLTVDGIGEVAAAHMMQYFQDPKHRKEIDGLLQEVSVEQEEAPAAEQNLAGITVVITGALQHFANRKELERKIEEHGGKVASAVSTRTDYLINNDISSDSAKNNKARQLSIPILSEDKFVEMFTIL